MKKGKRIEIDISGQIQQLNYDSALGFRRDNGIESSVYLRSKDKKDLINKYKGQILHLIEKIHCILIYYCIKDFLEDVNEIKICRDIDFRVLKNLLPSLFKELNYLKRLKIKPLKTKGSKSKAHRFALRSFRRRKHAKRIINKKMIEDILFEFKGKSKSKGG